MGQGWWGEGKYPPLDFERITFEYDDFMFGDNAGLTGGIGKLNWNFTLGSAGQSTSSSTPGNPGLSLRNTTVAVTGLYNFYGRPHVSPLDYFESVWIVNTRSPFFSDGLSFRIGEGNWVGNPPSHGCYFEMLSGETTFFAVCRQGGAQTRVNTGVAVVEGQWYKMKIWRQSATTIAFKINNADLVLIGSNLPTTALTPGNQIILTTAAVLHTVWIDYYHILVRGLAR
jgi:hypothetical protein